MVTNRLFSFAKYLDQPVLLERLRGSVPYVLPAAGAAYVAYDTFKTRPENRQKALVKGAAVTGATIGAALWGANLFLKPDAADVKQIYNALKPLIEKQGVKLSDKLKARIPKMPANHLLDVLKNPAKKPGSQVKIPKAIEAFVRKHGAKELSPLQYHQLKVMVAETLVKSTPANKSQKAVLSLLEKSKNKFLTPNEVHTLRAALAKIEPNPAKAKQLLHMVIPDPPNLSGKKLLGEIWDLSMLGLFPVVGGLIGGIAGNILNRDNWREAFKNQAKEGFFQYFANIVLCNIGAGVCLTLLEKFIPTMAQNRTARFASMIVGITAFGIVGGSAIANFFGKNLINGMIDNGPVQAFKDLGAKIANGEWQSMFTDLYSERKPEALDVGLHVDDVATVGVLSGLKWIEPALPFLYSISGVRTGMGYRNNGEHAKRPEYEPIRTASDVQQSLQVAPSLFKGKQVFQQFHYERQGIHLT